MKNNFNLAAAIAAALLAGAATTAQAQSSWLSPEGWSAGIGATRISPNVDSGTLTAPSSPGTQVDIGANTQPTVWVTRMLDDHWSLELPIAPGFKHEITGAGSIAGVGRIGSVKALPITLFAQYRFLDAAARVRPYAMVGATYAKFYGARGSATLNALNPLNPAGGTGLSVDSKLALSVGVGATIPITGKWFADVQYAHSFLKTTAHLSTGQTISTKLDPDAIRAGVGMKF
jgi:outer membrane protein